VPRLGPLCCSLQPTLSEATTKAEMGHEPTFGQAHLYLYNSGPMATQIAPDALPPEMASPQ